MDVGKNSGFGVKVVDLDRGLSRCWRRVDTAEYKVDMVGFWRVTKEDNRQQTCVYFPLDHFLLSEREDHTKRERLDKAVSSALAIFLPCSISRL